MKSLFKITPTDLIAIGVAVVLFSVGGLLGLSFFQSVLLVFVVLMVGGVGYQISRPFSWKWYPPVAHMLKRIREGEAEAVIAELEPQYTAGKLSTEMIAALAEAYGYVNRAAEAEPLARYVLADLGLRGVLNKRNPESRMLGELGALVLSDALTGQGRFIEAADMLRSFAPGAVRPNWITALSALYFYMGGETYNAQVMLSTVRPVGIRYWNMTTEKIIPPQYKFITNFLQMRLLGQDKQAALEKNSKQMDMWEAEYQRHAESPYGIRLRELLDEVWTALNLEQKHVSG